MRKKVRINHSSVYSRNPQKAALDLAALTDGIAKPFHPCEGAWVCFLNDEDWNSELIEFYPTQIKLGQRSGQLEFCDNPQGVNGAGTHFNLFVPKSRIDLEAICENRNLTFSWRDWASFLDVWLEEDLLIECIPCA